MENNESLECPSDEELFSLALGELSVEKRELMEAHIRHCSSCREVLAETLLSLEGGEPQEETSDEFPRLDRYVLKKVIGSGGAGIVYLALDPALDREVAIKLLRAGETSVPDLHRRLLREARAIARLTHTNVVTAYDVGESGSDVFIVLEYCPGGSLEAWLKEHEPTQAQILGKLIQAGKGLAAAHAREMVHRDFKPHNVLVRASGEACVTDFGLANFDDEQRQSRFAMDSTIDAATQTRGIMGTPTYMAPEVLAGEKADPLADQFSFCVTAYVALNGRHPFGVTKSTTLVELINRVQGGLYEACNPEIPDNIAKALERGLKARPEERFASMPELLGVLSQRQAALPWPWLLVGAVVLAAAAWFSLGSHAIPETPSPKLIQDSNSAATPPFATAAPRLKVPKAGVSAQNAASDADGNTSPAAAQNETPTNAELATPNHEPASAPQKAQAPRLKKRSQPAQKNSEKVEKKQQRYDDWLRDPF